MKHVFVCICLEWLVIVAWPSIDSCADDSKCSLREDRVMAASGSSQMQVQMTHRVVTNTTKDWCSNGIAERDVCCTSSCGTCGNDEDNCEGRPGGASSCCRASIKDADVKCGSHEDVACLIPNWDKGYMETEKGSVQCPDGTWRIFGKDMCKEAAEASVGYTWNTKVQQDDIQGGCSTNGNKVTYNTNSAGKVHENRATICRLEFKFWDGGYKEGLRNSRECPDGTVHIADASECQKAGEESLELRWSGTISFPGVQYGCSTNGQQVHWNTENKDNQRAKITRAMVCKVLAQVQYILGRQGAERCDEGQPISNKIRCDAALNALNIPIVNIEDGSLCYRAGDNRGFADGSNDEHANLVCSIETPSFPSGYTCDQNKQYQGPIAGSPTEASGIEDCAKICDDSDSCSAFVYTKTQGRCHMMSSITSIDDADSDVEMTSCQKALEPEDEGEVVSTYTIEEMSAGDTTIHIAYSEGLSIGDKVLIGGLETRQIIGFGSIILDRPLENSYPAGTWMLCEKKGRHVSQHHDELRKNFPGPSESYIMGSRGKTCQHRCAQIGMVCGGSGGVGSDCKAHTSESSCRYRGAWMFDPTKYQCSADADASQDACSKNTEQHLQFCCRCVSENPAASPKNIELASPSGGATTLSKDVVAGSTEVFVQGTAGFEAGNKISIGGMETKQLVGFGLGEAVLLGAEAATSAGQNGTSIQILEDEEFEGFGSMIIDSPLQYDYPAGGEVVTSRTRTGCEDGACSVWGDPHIKVFDSNQISLLSLLSNSSEPIVKRKSSNMKSGDFWLIRSKDVYIQGRYNKVQKRRNKPFLRALAIGGPFLKNSKVIIHPMSGHVLWNGTKISGSIAVKGLLQVNFHESMPWVQDSSQHSRGVELKLPLNVTILVNRHADILGAKIISSPLPGGQEGECGNYNGDASDDTEDQIDRRGTRVTLIHELLFDRWFDPFRDWKGDEFVDSMRAPARE